MTTRYANIIRAVLARPWAIDPDSIAWAAICDVLAMRAAGQMLSDADIEARIEAAANGPRHGPKRQASVAVLPLYGVISPRANMMARTSGGTTAESFAADFDTVVNDDEIDGIVIDIDSPGGNVEGIEEAAAMIRAARGRKPIVAVANHMAASAAYWIASAADEIVVTPSGAVGSIGVVAAHQDVSAAMEREGIRTTIVSAGKYKAEGNKFEPLGDEARATIQADADAFYGMFTLAVGKGRGVSVDTVRGGYGEGRTLLARAALDAGMVDRIDTLDATIRRVARGAVPVRALSEPATAAALGEDRYLSAADLSAGPIGRHKTGTSDGSWDGPANDARCPAKAGPLRASHAWVDSDGDPDAKSSYKFIHHEVGGDGAVGAANLTACSTGIGVLNGGRGGTTIPSGDRPGVHAHLAGHLTDGGREAPALNGEAASTTRVRHDLELQDAAFAGGHGWII